MYVAASYVLSSEKQFPSTKPNLWNVAQITNEINDDDFGVYLEDIITTRVGLERKAEVSQLASSLILTVKSQDYDEDTKQEKIKAINKLLEDTKDTTGIGLQDASKIIFNITPEKTDEETYTQLEIEEGVPQQDTLSKNHSKLHDSLLSTTYKLKDADKSKMSGKEYKQAAQKIVNNSIKINQFKEKFNISLNEVLKDLQQEKRNYREAIGSTRAAADYSPLSVEFFYKKYDNNTLAEMLTFMQL